MREVVSVHTGQAGVQLSSAVWQLLTTEHGLHANGFYGNEEEEESPSVHTFFQQIPSGHFVPRAISVDLEPSVLDEIRVGPYRMLFHPDQMISGFEDAANNFARGHYTLGKDIIDCVINKLRKVSEICENIQGFFILNSYGGGTGSGFGTLLLDRLTVEFSNKVVFQVAVFPSDKMSMATVEPYNTLLCTTFAIDKVGLCSFFDNESTYKICCKHLDIARPTYSNLNFIIAQIVSSLTASIRFEGFMNATLDQIITNLVPYPRIHFPIFAHAPIISGKKGNHQVKNVRELTNAVFLSGNQLVNVNMTEGRYICCCLQYRGNVSSTDVNNAIFDIKRRPDVRFVDWCPTGFKLGINSQPPCFIPKSEMAQSDSCVTLLSNSSAISQKFISLLEKYDILYHKKCFIHWFVGEGLEEMEFKESREEMSLISADYFELCLGDEDECPQVKNDNKDKKDYSLS